MSRRDRSFRFDNKTGQLEIAGKTIIDSENNDNIVSTTGSTTGNAVQVVATGDDTDIDLRISAKGAGNIELRSTVELLSGKRIIDSAGTKVEFGDAIDMNSNKITEVGTPTASTDAATKGYVDTYYLPLTGGTVSSNLTISGNLTVSGTTTTVNSETITLADNIIELNSNASGTPTENAGITVNRGSSADVTLRWNETSDVWEMTTDGTTYQTIGSLASSDTDDLSEGSTNLYYTDTRARAAISVTDSGGDGSLSYSNGVITYTGPSASEVRAHFSAGTGVSISSGAVSIGQDVATSATPTFAGATMTDAIAMGSNKITGMADPTSAQDAATKAYVDSSLSSVITVTDGSNSTALGDGSTLTFSGTANEVTVAQSSGTITVGLPSSITANLTGNVTGNVTGNLTGTASNATTAVTLTGLTSTIAELNVLDGITATVAELNYTDGVTSNIQTQLDAKLASASYTAADVLTKIKTVDGAGSGLDADLLDGVSSASFLRSDATDSASGALTFSGGLTMTSALTLNAQNQLRFADSDSSHYVGFAAPANVTGNNIWTLPGSDGTEGQVLSTNGGNTLSWADPGSGGGSGSSYPNSTFSTMPGTDGNFDLSYNVAQTTQETPFEASGTDAFGVNLGSVFSMMDPIGSFESLDLGALS